MREQLNVEHAAKLLGLSIHTLYSYIRYRRIPFRKIGSRVLFDPDELENWLKSKAVPPFPSHDRRRNALAAARREPS